MQKTLIELESKIHSLQCATKDERDKFIFQICRQLIQDKIDNQHKDERNVEATKTISYQKLDCPYDFTSRCTMGSCDCKPIKETTSSQTEISDEEIEKFVDEELGTIRTDFDFGVIQGMKFYREELKKK